MVNYRKILSAYIEHVGFSEGIDFLPMEPAGLSEQELLALYEVANESRPAWAKIQTMPMPDHDNPDSN